MVRNVETRNQDLRIKSLLEIFYRGDHLTDYELAQLLAHMECATDLLSVMGPEFRLPFMESNRIAMGLRSYQECRRQNEKRG